METLKYTLFAGVVTAAVAVGYWAISNLEGCSGSLPDKEAFPIDVMYARYWCCREGSQTCWPGKDHELEYLKGSRHSSRARIVAREEYELLDEENRFIFPKECGLIWGYGNKDWNYANARYESGELISAPEFHEARQQTYALTFEDVVREEKQFRAFPNRGDCLEWKHMVDDDDQWQERYGRVSECAIVRLTFGSVEVCGQHGCEPRPE